MHRPAAEIPRAKGWTGYMLLWQMRRALWRSFRSRHVLRAVTNRTASISRGAVLAVMVVRNESLRLPFFLDWHRRLGVDHFLIVDNASTDGSAEILAQAQDVSLWTTNAPYREARFGLDWSSWLLMRYGAGHWCLTLDADELFMFAHHDTQDLHALTTWLETRGRGSMGALMLDLYPEGPLGADTTKTDPMKVLCGFDPAPYRASRQAPMRNLWVQGGVRERMFFADAPERSPTLNKLPLIKWRPYYAYVNSTHAALPSRLNMGYAGPGGNDPSGVLLHTKFLPDVVPRAREDQARQQHFHDPTLFAPYYEAIATSPTLWHAGSERLRGWEDLERLGLMNSGGWTPDETAPKGSEK